jgi:hypothetical protein
MGDFFNQDWNLNQISDSLDTITNNFETDPEIASSEVVIVDDSQLRKRNNLRIIISLVIVAVVIALFYKYKK